MTAGVFPKWENIFYFCMFMQGNMKALLSPVSIYWFNAVLLTNIHCCLNGSQVITNELLNVYQKICLQISDFFECDPPTVEEYLNL